MIPQNLSINIDINEIIKDNEGRLIALNCIVENKTFLKMNVYCPTKDNQEGQLTFLETIKNTINDFSDSNIIIGGDFNTYLDINKPM